MTTPSMRYTKGFTIVELLIVISILGVVMAIVITSYGNSVQRAHDQQVKANAESIRTSLELFRRSGNGYYPTSLNLLKSASYDVPNFPRTNSVDDYNYTPLPPTCEVLNTCTTYEMIAYFESSDEVYIATPNMSEVTNDPALNPTSAPTNAPTLAPSKTPIPTATKTPVPTATRTPTPTPTRTPTPTPYDCNMCPEWILGSIACGAEVGCPSGQAQYSCRNHLPCKKCFVSNQCYVAPTIGPTIRTPTVPFGWGGGETF